MNYTGLLLILAAVLIIYESQKERNTAIIRKHLRSKRGKKDMTELIEKYIGKECIIYTCNSSSQISGTIISCKDSWLEIERNGETDIVNCEYITRIREYPRNKNGKKKSIIVD